MGYEEEGPWEWDEGQGAWDEGSEHHVGVREVSIRCGEGSEHEVGVREVRRIHP